MMNWFVNGGPIIRNRFRVTNRLLIGGFLYNISMNSNKIYKMSFSKVYPLYITKVKRKGHTKEEVDEVIRWLTGYSQKELENQIEKENDFETFFAQAKLNPNRKLITGIICGMRVEEIEEPLMQEIRYMDKLIDELARGKAMEKILRK